MKKSVSFSNEVTIVKYRKKPVRNPKKCEEGEMTSASSVAVPTSTIQSQPHPLSLRMTILYNLLLIIIVLLGSLGSFYMSNEADRMLLRWYSSYDRNLYGEQAALYSLTRDLPKGLHHSGFLTARVSPDLHGKVLRCNDSFSFHLSGQFLSGGPEMYNQMHENTTKSSTTYAASQNFTCLHLHLRLMSMSALAVEERHRMHHISSVSPSTPPTGELTSERSKRAMPFVEQPLEKVFFLQLPIELAQPVVVSLKLNEVLVMPPSPQSLSFLALLKTTPGLCFANATTTGDPTFVPSTTPEGITELVDEALFYFLNLPGCASERSDEELLVVQKPLQGDLVSSPVTLEIAFHPRLTERLSTFVLRFDEEEHDLSVEVMKQLKQLKSTISFSLHDVPVGKHLLALEARDASQHLVATSNISIECV
eukprot:gene2784-3038_t